MTRIGAILCRVNSHRYEKPDDFGRCHCERCGIRQPVEWRILTPEEKQGREMIRPKTKGAKR